MSPNGGVFFDEWQACLRAHYLYVLQTEDWVTELTLRRVLLNAGFSEEDVALLHQQAAESDPQFALEAASSRVDLPAPPEPAADEDDGPEALTLAEGDELLQGDEAEVGDGGAALAADDELPAEDMDADPDEDVPAPYEPPPNQLSLF